MQNLLKSKLHSYLIYHNPELILSLSEDFSVKKYLEEKVAGIASYLGKLIDEGKPAYIIEELCMDKLTAELRPSRFLYLRGKLENHFGADYQQMREAGTLTYETVNLIEHCKKVFESQGFSEANENDQDLQKHILEAISDYLNPKAINYGL